MLIASPRRSGGARSLTAARSATKKKASAIPSSDRATTNNGNVVATRWNSIATTVSSPPSTSSGRRPKRSEAQPTTGRRARAAIAKAPIEMPTPVASACSGPAANREATGNTTLPDVKNTSAAANSAANAGVKSRGAEVIRPRAP